MPAEPQLHEWTGAVRETFQTVLYDSVFDQQRLLAGFLQGQNTTPHSRLPSAGTYWFQCAILWVIAYANLVNRCVDQNRGFVNSAEGIRLYTLGLLGYR